MVLTRAGKKRELEKESGSSDDETQAAKKKLKTSKQVAKPVKKAVTTATQKKKPKGLLDLPAELRNRIYHFASEQDFGGKDKEGGWMNAVPLVAPRKKDSKPQWPIPERQNCLSGRNFLGLTQTCKQIRAEYRPIWLRNSSLRTRLYHLPSYLHSFYGCSHNYINLPKLLQISFDHVIEDYVDITQLLRIRAAHPAVKIEFVPHLLTLEEGPWGEDFDGDCEFCEEEIKEGTMNIDDYEDFGCSHGYLGRLGFGVDFIEDEYPYLEFLNKLLAHNDPKWLDDVRNHDVSRVKLDTTGGYRELPDISIRLVPQTDVVGSKLADKSMREAARDYITSRNLRDVNTEAATLHFELLVCGACIQ